MARIPDGQYLKGVADVSRRLTEKFRHLDNISPNRMKLICLDVQLRAMEKAPVDTGTMIGTSYTDVRQEGDTVVGEVHFPEKYAGKQHEDLTLHHTNGEAKFLEKAMIEKEEQIRGEIADMIREAFGGA